MPHTLKSLNIKKIRTSFFLLLIAFCFLLFSSPVLAQNKCGINVGPNYRQVSQVRSTVGQGGWIVALGNLGDCTNFESLFGQGLNVVIRAYNGGNVFTNDQAIAWVATLGKMDTKGQKFYFMPWNEPNHENEGGGPGAGPASYAYTQFLKNKLAEAGLLNNKVVVLSPMVDKLNPTFVDESFFNNVPGGKSGYYKLGSGSSINEYDQYQNGYCRAIPAQNNCKYDEIGIPAQYYALESGVAGTDCGDGKPQPCYKDNEIRAMLDTVGPKWKGDPNFKMFAIFSYDPHRNNWNIFNASSTVNFYRTNCSPGSVESGNADQNKFNDWLYQNEATLVSCGGCGYAPKGSPGLCNASGPTSFEDTVSGRIFKPSRQVETNDITESISDTVKLEQKASISYPNTGPMDVTRGGFFEQFHDMTIPFAKELTRYLAGPFVRVEGDGSNLVLKHFNENPTPETAGVLAKLYPEQMQDLMRHLYRWKCGNQPGDANGYYCSNRTIGKTADCPGPESNECLLSNGTEIADGPRKPWPEDPEFLTNGKYDPVKYAAALKIWESDANAKNRALWHETPLVSNPNTFVEQAINIQACPAGGSSTTTSIRVPWVSALKDVSKNLNDLLMPKEPPKTSSINIPAGQSPLGGAQNSLNPPNAQNTLLASAKFVSPNTNVIARSVATKQSAYLLAQAAPQNNCLVNINTTDGNNFEVVPNTAETGCYYRDVNISGGAYTCDGNSYNTGTIPVMAFNAPFKFSCPPGTKSVGISFSQGAPQGNCGHPQLNGNACTCTVTGQTTSCSSSPPITVPPVCVPPGVPPNKEDGSSDPVSASGHTLFRDWPKSETLSCSKWSSTGDCLDGTTDYNVSDPLWAIVKYPFLNTIYEKLSGEKGIFRLFKPSQETVKDWDYAGQSKITYCITRDTRASSMNAMSAPGLNIDKQSFDEPLARCGDNEYTDGIIVYPDKIGGVKNAEEWVTDCVLQPANERSASCKSSFSGQESSPTPAGKNCDQKGSSSCPVLTYDLNNVFKNPNDKIPNEKKQLLVDKVKTRFPQSIITLDRLIQIEDWSKKNNWGPAFITALWIEETGASHTVVAGASNDAFGCVPQYWRKKTFEESLNCLTANFSKLWKDYPFTFENFMLQYSALDDLTKWRCFCQNPNFPRNIKEEYDFVKNP